MNLELLLRKGDRLRLSKPAALQTEQIDLSTHTHLKPNGINNPSPQILPYGF
ncbi:MAG: hypothetical protein WCA35_03950 [Kovacikia sp.]